MELLPTLEWNCFPFPLFPLFFCVCALCSSQSKLVTLGHDSHTSSVVAAFCHASIIRNFLALDLGAHGYAVWKIKPKARNSCMHLLPGSRSKTNLWHILKEWDAQVHFLNQRVDKSFFFFFLAPSAQGAISVGCPIELISGCVRYR